MPAEPRGFGCFFQRKVKRFSGGWRADDVVRLFAETVKATNLFVEIFVTSKCGVKIVEKLLLLIVFFDGQTVLEGNATDAVGNAKCWLVGRECTEFVAQIARAHKRFID